MTKKGIRILLVYPNPMMDNLIPLGLSLISAELKNAGHEVKLFDTTFYNCSGIRGDDYREKNLEVLPTSLENYGISRIKSDIHEDFATLINEFQPDLIGVSVIEPTYLEGLNLLKNLKEKNIPVIVGGVHSTISGDEVIKEDCINMICVGEGEDAMVELANKIRDNQDYTEIQNLWVKKNGKVTKNQLRPLKNMDELPIQDWEIYDKKRLYKPYFGEIAITAAIETSRGCYGNCTFCSNPTLRNKYCGQQFVRFKSPEKVVEEINVLKNKYNLQFINLVDPDFFARSTEDFKKLAEVYKKIKVPFWAEGRAVSANAEKVSLLQEMGCKGFALGIESGDEEIRTKVLKKAVTNQKLIEAFELFTDTEIKVTANNIIGLPYESRENIFKTIELNRQLSEMNKNFRSSVTVFVPYSGSELKEVCIREKYISENYSPGDYRGEMLLNMPQISKEELAGIHRTFLMYVKFPKSLWPEIKIAEQDDSTFEKLSKLYSEKYIKPNQK